MTHTTGLVVAATLVAWTSAAVARQPAAPVDRSLPWVTDDAAVPRVAFRTFESVAAAGPVSYHVYAPAEYDEPEARLPVLYWLHGTLGGISGIRPLAAHFDAAIRAGRMPPMLVVFVNGLPRRLWADSKDGSAPVETVFITELIPEVDRSFRTVATREGRILEGFSMGGYGAARLGFAHPDLFAGISILAGGPLDLDLDGPRARRNPRLREFLVHDVCGGDLDHFKAISPWMLAESAAAAIRDRRTVIRQAVGTRDDTRDLNRTFHERMAALGIDHGYHDIPDVGHDAAAVLAALVTIDGDFYRRALATADVRPVHADAAESRPNVVLIVADDLGWGELGCYGQARIPTPNIDRLAVEGMRFTQFYSGAPVCAPSRCVLMTGRHLGHAEIRGNQQAQRRFPEFTEGQHPLSAGVRTFPQVFRDAGYATGAMGKWGLGPVGSTGDPAAKGIDVFFGYNCQAAAHSYYPRWLWRNAERVPLNEKPVPGHAEPVTGAVDAARYVGTTYASRPIVAEAERFIADHAGRPFLLYLPFIEPHLAMHPPPETVARFPRDWDEGREPYRGDNGYLPHPRPRAAYAAMIAELDDHVGRILDALDKAGVADRTLVVFTSDNGPTHAGSGDPRFHVGGVDVEFFASTAGLRGFKGSVLEGGIRVPFIARLPGVIDAGTVCDAPGYFADLFPTLCAAADLPLPAGLDGENLWPVLTGIVRSPETRRPLVWVFPEYGGQVAVRMGDMKVLRRGLATKKPDDWEVYDLAHDPGETKNLAADRPELVAEAVAILRRETDENEVFPVSIPPR